MTCAHNHKPASSNLLFFALLGELGVDILVLDRHKKTAKSREVRGPGVPFLKIEKSPRMNQNEVVGIPVCAKVF